MANGMRQTDTSPIRVWNLPVRLFHWSLAASFAIAWLSADNWDDLHEWAGYAAAALIAFRLVYGVFGSRYARFSQFVRGPSVVVAYLKAMLRGEEQRYIGHNPAGSFMIVGLIVAMTVTATTGWMYTLDAFWGEEWVENVHSFTADLMLIMVAVHILGVLYASRKHHENLVAGMISGNKRAPSEDDIG